MTDTDPTDPVADRLAAAAARVPPPPGDLPGRLAHAAGDAGLLDVAWAWADTPVGRVMVAATSHGVVRIAYPANDPDAVLDTLAAQVSPRVLEAPERLDGIRRQLDDYFAGRRRTFDVAVDWALVGEFGRQVLEACAAIPYGAVTTYGELSAAIGRPGAARAVGNALGANPIPVVVPCHRVLRAGGALGGYTGGLGIKRHLLTLEGVLLA